ncbi:MAG TPA: hypothetical protein VF636_01980 [Sphingomonas sp.]
MFEGCDQPTSQRFSYSRGSSSSRDVLDQVPGIEAAIARIDDLQSFVENVTAFLRVVDKAIGVAKLVI